MNRISTVLSPRRFNLLSIVVLLLLIVVSGIVPLVSAQPSVTVTPATVQQITTPLAAGQMAVYVTRGNTSTNPETSTGRYTFAVGPSVPPLGSGSLRMSAGSGTGTGNGGRIWAATHDLTGTLLSSISTLSYSSYVAFRNGSSTAPSLNLYVDLNNNGTWEFASDSLLVFEPYWQSTTSVGVWQTWDAAAGRWWDTRNQVANGGGGGACNRTFAQIVAGTNPGGCSTTYAPQPNARVISAGFGQPSLYVVSGDSTGSGGWVNFDGYIDALNTGVNIYNFEPASTVYVDPAWASTPDLTAAVGIVAHSTPFGTAPFTSTCVGPAPHYYKQDGFGSLADVFTTLGAGYAGTILDCSSFLPTDTPVPTNTPLPTNTPVPTTTTGPLTPTSTPAPTNTAAPTGVPASPTPQINAATAPLCSLIGGGTNSIVRADVPDNTVTRGSVFCQVIAEHSRYIRNASEIGVPEVIAMQPLQAVDVFGLLHSGDSWPDFNNSINICLAGSGRRPHHLPERPASAAPARLASGCRIQRLHLRQYP